MHLLKGHKVDIYWEYRTICVIHHSYKSIDSRFCYKQVLCLHLNIYAVELPATHTVVKKKDSFNWFGLQLVDLLCATNCRITMKMTKTNCIIIIFILGKRKDNRPELFFQSVYACRVIPTWTGQHVTCKKKHWAAINEVMYP